MLDDAKLHQFIGQMLSDLGGAASVALVHIGDALGLYKALCVKGPMTVAELATEAGVHQRYLREWLSHQAASKYVSYDPATQKFSLSPEQAMVFAIEDSPVNLIGAFETTAASLGNQELVKPAFKTGTGVRYETHFASWPSMQQILISNGFDKESFEMRSLNLDQLRTFVEVVSRGNFSAAGRQLNLTQPAVSLHVRELEQRFGVRLVERVGRQAYATAPGRDLVEHAQQIFRDCEEIESTMRRFREGWLGLVHIGTTLTALTYELPPILRRIRTEYPGIDLLVTNMPTRDSVENIMKNAIDIALVTLPVKEPRLRITPLRPEMLVAILPVDAKEIPKVITPAFAARQSLVLEHARGAVHALVTQWLSAEMPLPSRPMLVGTVEAMKTIVSLGLGMSIVPDVAVSEPTPNFMVRPLKPAVPCTLGLIELRNKPSDPALDIVRAELLELRVGI